MNTASQRYIKWTLVVIYILCSYSLPVFASEGEIHNKEPGKVIGLQVDEIIIKYKSNITKNQVFKISQGSLEKANKRLGISRVKLARGQNLQEALVDFQKDPNVLYAEPNYRYRALGEPNDTDYYQQWALPTINAPLAWDETLGNDVVVAVIDSGVDNNHPEFFGRLVSGYNAMTQLEGENVAQDDEGHGTHVAGIVGAAINNEIGIAGVAPKVKIMPVKVLDQDGCGYADDIAEGIIWAADHGAQVINLSLGSENNSQTVADAVEYAYTKGAVIVAAAGNIYQGYEYVNYPAALPNVMAVSSTDQNDELYSGSCWGDEVDVSAPGVNIYSTYYNSGYEVLTGTSMAAPHVSGIAALIISKYPQYSNAQVEETIEISAVDLGEEGWDPKYGYGMIDAYAALKADTGNDINKDGQIDLADLTLVAQNYGCTIQSSNWNSSLDLNEDGTIDIFDLVIISKKLS